MSLASYKISVTYVNKKSICQTKYAASASKTYIVTESKHLYRKHCFFVGTESICKKHQERLKVVVDFRQSVLLL